MADGSSTPSFAWPPFPQMEEGSQSQWPQNPSLWPPFPASGYYWGFPGEGNRGGGGGGGGGGMGAGTIILVAVLVTGFSLMMLLLLRLWFCGCSQDDDARGAAPVPAVASKLAVGLRRDVVESFQVVSYQALLAMNRGRSQVGDCCCPVCLVDFGDEDKRIRVLPGCGHGFHTECIDMWLFSHTSCPVCRRDLVQDRRGSIEVRDDRVVVIEMGQIHRERG